MCVIYLSCLSMFSVIWCVCGIIILPMFNGDLIPQTGISSKANRGSKGPKAKRSLLAPKRTYLLSLQTPACVQWTGLHQTLRGWIQWKKGKTSLKVDWYSWSIATQPEEQQPEASYYTAISTAKKYNIKWWYPLPTTDTVYQCLPVWCPHLQDYLRKAGWMNAASNKTCHKDISWDVVGKQVW